MIEHVAPVIELYFGDRAPARTPTMIRLGKQDLDIPPGVRHHTITDAFVLPAAAEVLAIQPHAHYRARSVEAVATLPDGSRRPLPRRKIPSRRRTGPIPFSRRRAKPILGGSSENHFRLKPLRSNRLQRPQPIPNLQSKI